MPTPYFEATSNIVTQQMFDMVSRADTFQRNAELTIASLATLNFDLAIAAPVLQSATINIPTQSRPSITTPIRPDIEQVDSVDFEQLTIDQDIELEDVPQFYPTVGMPIMPNAPQPLSVGQDAVDFEQLTIDQSLDLEPSTPFNPSVDMPVIPEAPRPLSSAQDAVAFELLTVDQALDLETPSAFVPTIALPTQLPESPRPIVPGTAPTRPQIADIDIPAAPVIAEPELELLPQTLPDLEFEFPTLPVFADPDAVEFEGARPSLTMDWTETPYVGRLLDALTTQIRTWMAGGTGMHPDVEAALFARARSRDDEQARKALQEAVDVIASRGFELPSGILAAQITATIEASRLAAQSANRDIMIEAARWEQENLRFAVSQGIAIESLLMTQHNQIVERSFQAARAKMDAEVQLYNFAIALFNAKQSARSIALEVYKAKLQAQLAKIDVFRARIEEFRVRADVSTQYNNTLAQVFATRMDGLRRHTEVFAARIDATRAQADIERLRIEGWRGELEAWVQTIGARRVEWDAYKVRMDAEASKATMYEAEARAFATTVAAADGRNNTKVALIRAKIDAMQASVGLFSARVQEQTQRTGIELENARNEWLGYKSQVDAQATKANILEAETRAYAATSAASDSRNNTRVALIRAKVDALNASVGLYSARVQEKAQSTDVAIENARNQWAGYKAQVDAEAQKANMFEAEARAYSATVGAADGRNNTRVALIRAKVDALNASVGLYQARVQEEGQRVNAQVEQARTSMSTYAADVQRYSAELSADNADRALRVQANEADLRNNTALLSVLSQQWQTAQQTVIQQATLQSEAIKAAGALSSQLAAGAFSAIHVQAGISGGTSSSDSYSTSHNYSHVG